MNAVLDILREGIWQEERASRGGERQKSKSK